MLQNVYIAWPLTSIKSLYLLQKYWVFCDFFSSHAYKLGYGFKSTEFNYIKKKKKQKFMFSLFTQTKHIVTVGTCITNKQK